jgi:hypothetical protein
MALLTVIRIWAPGVPSIRVAGSVDVRMRGSYGREGLHFRIEDLLREFDLFSEVCLAGHPEY